MKRPLLILNVFAIIFVLGFEIYKFSSTIQLTTETGKTSYSLGQDVGKTMLRQGIQIEEASFIQGFKDGLKQKSEITAEEERLALAWAKNQAQLKFAEIQKSRDEKLKDQIQKINQRGLPLPAHLQSLSMNQAHRQNQISELGQNQRIPQRYIEDPKKPKNKTAPNHGVNQYPK